MRCPYCSNEKTKVLETRASDEGDILKRKRLCEDCNKRFYTYERVEAIPLTVLKKDGTRARFKREKLIKSLSKACHKRPISDDEIRELAFEVERSFWGNHDEDIHTAAISEEVMSRLKKTDPVAYMRYASNYREFIDLDDFMDEVKALLDK